MPTSTVPSSATETDLTMPRSVIGRWISGSETVASAAWTASTSTELIVSPGYVGRSADLAAPGDQRQQALLEHGRLDRLAQEVVGACVPCFALQVAAAVTGEQHHRQHRGACLAAQQPDQLDTGEVRQHVVDEHAVVVAVGRLVDAFAGSADGVDLDGAGQRRRDIGAHCGIVVDEENTRQS